MGYDLNPSSHLTRGKGGRQVWVAEEIGILETALANQPLGIDHKPAVRFAIKHIIMVDITMKNHRLSRVCEQRSRDASTSGEGSAVLSCCDF